MREITFWPQQVDHLLLFLNFPPALGWVCIRKLIEFHSFSLFFLFYQMVSQLVKYWSLSHCSRIVIPRSQYTCTCPRKIIIISPETHVRTSIYCTEILYEISLESLESTKDDDAPLPKEALVVNQKFLMTHHSHHWHLRRLISPSPEKIDLSIFILATHCSIRKKSGIILHRSN